MPQPPIFELLLLVFVLGGIGLVFWYSTSQRTKSEQSNTYLEALESLADGYDWLAIQKLKETVREDTENVAAYLRLGDLLRRKGMLGNAVRIHKDLTLRGGLDRELRLKILKSLFLDYEQLQDTHNAIKTGQEILELDPNPDAWVIQKLLEKYVLVQDWSAAESLLLQHKNRLSGDIDKRLALYTVFQGLDLQAAGREKEARVKFKEAIKKDHHCEAAYYFLGQSYLAEERLEDAVNAWTRLCRAVPEKAYIVYPLLEKAWYELGRYFDAENLYREHFNANQNRLEAGLALAEIYAKKGDFDNAMTVIDQLEENFANSPQLMGKKISLYFTKGQYKQAASQSLTFLENLDGIVSRSYTCNRCGNTSKTPQWICPKCHHIDTYNI